MQTRFHFFNLIGHISYSTMIPSVVLALLLVTPTFSLPVTSQEFVSTGSQDPQTILANTGLTNSQETTGEKSQDEGVGHTVTGTNVGSSAETSPTKSNAIKTPTNIGQISNLAGQEGYSTTGQTVKIAITRGQSNTPTQYSGSGTTSQGERTQVQVPTGSHQYSETYPQNTPLEKVEDVVGNVEQKQPYQPDNPALLPVQPLTVVPVNQAGEFLEPVVVPAEAVTAGRVILMAIKPIQQRNFQDVITPPGKHFPYQEVTQAVTQGSEQAQATAFGQPVGNEEIQRGSQTQTPVQQQPNQVPFIKEQVVPHPDFAQQPVEAVSNYVSASAAAPNPQTYNVQPGQPVVNEYVQKQIPQQPAEYTAGHTQFTESTPPQQQTYNVQQLAEKQGAFQQSNYNPHQVQPLYQQQGNPVTVNGVQSQQPNQVNQPYQNRIAGPTQHQQSEQTPYQQNTDYVSVQNPQVYSVQSESQQNYSPVEPQPVQQKVSDGQSGHQESYIPGQPHTVQQIQTGEKQAPSLQPVQTVQYEPQEPVHQQQVSSVQSFASVPTASQLPVQPVQPEKTEYVPQQLHKTSEQQTDRVVGAQPPQIVNYAEPIYNFGDKIPQNPTVQQNNPFASCQQ